MQSVSESAVDTAIHVDGLHKSYGAVDAVSGVTFRVRRGRVTGFLGPNGAGKTTTLRAILDLCSPTAGRATINGRRYRELARPLHVVGAALDGAAFSPSQSAVDHLRIYAPLCGADDSRVDELLEVVGLTDAAQRRVGQFSLGMKQRLALATALLGRPEILILDEPANGLDPQGIVWLRFFLRSFVEDSGGTVLVSSHLLAEMEQMVDDVVLVDAGQVVYDGTLADLVNPGTESCVVHGRAVEEVARVLEHAGVPVRRASMGVAVADASPTETARITATAEIDPSGFALSRVNLETAFLELTAPGRR